VFISYARRTETTFVDRLQDALSARQLDCWIDREDILPSSPWRAEIEQAILESHAMAFVISPESVTSPYCRAELERGVALGKRLIPIVAKQTPGELVPTELAELQFISFTEEEAGDEVGFERQVDELVEALSTDLDAVHLHTRLLTLAERWVQRSSDRSLLLRGRELSEAERWLDEQTSAGRVVLPHQQRLVRESRQAAIRRQRGSVTVALAISTVMAVLAVITALEWRVAVDQRRQADIERDRVSSLDVAQEAQGQLPADPQLALLLALRAYGFSPTLPAQGAIRSAVAESSLRAALPLVGAEGGWPFDATGKWVVASGAGPNGLALITVARVPATVGRVARSPAAVLKLAHSAVTSAQFNPDGDDVLALVTRFPAAVHELISWDWRSRAGGYKVLGTVFSSPALDRQGSLVASIEGDGRVALQDSAGGRVIRALVPDPRLGGVTSLTFSPDGHFVVALGNKASEVFSTAGTVVGTLGVVGVTAAFAPDDSRLAVGIIGPEVEIFSLSSLSAPLAVHDLELPNSLGVHCCDVDLAASLAWSPDGTALAVGTEDPVVWLWSGASVGTSGAAPVYLQYGNEGEGPGVGSVAFSPNGQFLVEGNLMWQWRATLDEELKGSYESLVFDPKGDTVATAAQSGGIELWDWRAFTTGWLVEPRAQVAPNAVFYTNLTFSPDGAYLAATLGATVSVWALATLARVAQLALPHGPNWGGATSLAFSPSGSSLAIAAQAGTGENNFHYVVLRWAWGSARPPDQLPLSGRSGYLAGFSAQGIRVLTTPVTNIQRPSTLIEWDGVTRVAPRLLVTIPQRDGWDDAALLPGNRLLLADQAGVALFNIKTRRLGPQIKGYELGFRLAPSGDLAALTTSSGKVEVWDLNGNDTPLVAFTPQGQAFPAVAWGSSGSVLGIADPVDGAEVMPAVSFLPVRQLLVAARRLAVTTLTKAEQRDFIP
jgi:WD40 repeat protein